MSESDTASIYALLDPRNQSVRYIGKTIENLERRLKGHIDDCSKYRSHRANWIKLLRSLGKKPIIFLLEEVPEEFWRDAERFWIKHFRSIGAKLTNETDGGDSGMRMSPESRARMSTAKKGKPSPNKGKKVSPEIIAKIVAAKKGKPGPHKGRKFNDKWRENMSRARLGNTFKKGKKVSAEGRARIGESHKGLTPWNKGIPMTAEAKAHLSAILKGKPGRNKGKKFSPLACANIRAAAQKRKRIFSAETRAKLSAAARRRWDKAKAVPAQLPLDI